MKIYLIRHGETTGDVEDRYGGDYDDHLTKKGKNQSEQLATILKGKNIEIIYHSPLIRARETALILARSLQTELRMVAGIKERNNYGVLTGMTKAEAKKNFPNEVEKLKIKLDHKVKDSEDYEAFKPRVIDAWQYITDLDYDTIAIVTHGGVIRCIYKEILKLGWLEKIGDCGYLIIELINDKTTLIKIVN